MKINITLNRLFRIGLVALGIITIIVYFSVEHYRYFNETSLLLALGFIVLQYFVSGTLAKRYPVIWMVLFMVTLMVSIRLTCLAYNENWIRINPQINSEIFNHCLAYMLVGLALCILGIVHGGKLGKMSPRHSLSGRYVDFKFISLCFLFALFCWGYSFFAYGYWGQSGSGKHLNFFSRYVIRFIEPSVVKVLFFVSFFYALNRNYRSTKTILIAVLTIYMIYMTIIGTRSGVLEVILPIVGTYFLFKDTLRFRFTILQFSLSLFALLALPILFHAATNFRALTWYTQTESSEELKATPEILVQMASERASLIEATLRPLFANELEYYDISGLVNLKTTILSTINRVIPGHLLGDILYSEFAYSYLISSEGHIALDSMERVDYNSYEWGMWGINYQLFGYFGGLFAIYVFSFLFSLAIQILKHRATYGSLCVASLLTFEVSCFVRTLGLDNFGNRFGNQIVLLIGYLWLFRATESINTAPSLPTASHA